MMNAFRRSFRSKQVFGVAFSLGLCALGFSAAASAQDTSSTALTPFQRQMEKIDLGLGAAGEFTPSNSGTNYISQTVAQRPSRTVGALIELRYTKSPLIGFELTYSQFRYTDDFTVTGTNATPASQKSYILGVQSKVAEYSFGYVAHGPTFLGAHTWGGAGVGAVEFKPTAGGGQSLPPEVRTGIYYHVGLDEPLLGEHFGLRLQFRQLFFGAPDYNENYLANGQRSISTEPGVGFFLRF